MIVRPYEKGDEIKIIMQESQEYMGQYEINSDDLEMLSDRGLVWTGEHEGEIIAIAGVFPVWQGRGQAWALVSRRAGKHMTHVHKAVKNFLIRAPFKRIEATVDVGFREGVRWMKLLGFELEGYMKAYRPDGADMLLFARVRR